MFQFLKEFFKIKHRHTDSVEIKLLSHKRSYGLIGKFRQDNSRYLTGNLHRCLTCGELTDLGLQAQANGEKVGNYYSLRQSLKLARALNKMGYYYDLMKLRKKKLAIRRNGNEFEFYEK